MAEMLCINGPNLDLLGRRDPDLYGHSSLADLEDQVVAWGNDHGVTVSCVQSNHEGELVEAVHSAQGLAGALINPGALTHTSTSLHDAVSSVDTPFVEVHLSNVRQRDRWRRRSLMASAAVATIQGRGAEGYRAAIRHLVNRLAHPIEEVRYGPHPDQVIDVRRGDGRGPGVVLIHGGFWLDAWGRDTTESWALDLARRGVSTANLEYRRLHSGGSPVATPADAVEGVTAAMAALGATDAAVIGHSAGSQLAVWAAVHGAPPPLAVISVSGVLDLERAIATGIGKGAVARFAGDSDLSPLRLPVPQAQVHLVHGDADKVVPVQQSERYAGYLRENGGDPQLRLVAGAGHFDVLSSESVAWKDILDVLPGMGISFA